MITWQKWRWFHGVPVVVDSFTVSLYSPNATFLPLGGCARDSQCCLGNGGISHRSHEPMVHCNFPRIQHRWVPQSINRLANHASGSTSQSEVMPQTPWLSYSHQPRTVEQSTLVVRFSSISFHKPISLKALTWQIEGVAYLGVPSDVIKINEFWSNRFRLNE